MRLRMFTITAGMLLLASSAQAAAVPEETAVSAASGFLRQSAVASRVLSGREVLSAQARGSLWIVALEPSGYIEVAGSTKCAPILSFSSHDFAEPEVGSPFAAKLTGDSMMVDEKEADESLEDNADWAKYTAPVAKKRTLLKAAPSTADSGSVVGPLMNCGWGQGAPFNDLSPLSSLCGCMATAAGQEHRYWRWPYRYEKSRQGAHGLRNSLGEYSEHVLRPDGCVPFNYDKIVAYAPNPSSTPQATDKEATYQTAWLSLWMQSLTGMSYKPGASGGTQKLCNFAEDYWFEKGPVMSYWRDGYTNLWNAIKADLDFGSPIQVNSPGHQMVVDGYAIENEGEANEVDYININYGWGSPEGWVNLLTAVTENTSGGRLADFQIGYRPQKIVQFEPVPKVCTSEVTLKWHLPPCYTNRTTGFAVEIAKDGGEPTVDNVATHEETTTYTATGLASGSTYTFTVTPLMSDGSEARPNSATTTIGTPKPAPEIISVSSVACGIELMQQGLFVECGRGITNKINVACSTSVTSLNAYSSHLTVLPDNKVSCVDNGNGSWTVNVDAASMSKDWDGDMLILTLIAANADGTEAYKNLMLRFNSMRNVLGGTFEIVETSATSPVWFAGGTTTTLDAKGQAVTFASGAINGTGTIILTDSVGNGSFAFEGLNGFSGTLKWEPSVTVNLPADMSNFAGTLNFDSYASTYRLSSSLGANAKVYIGGTTQLYIDGSTAIDAAVTGGGYIMVVGSAPTFGNLSGFTGHISLGDFDDSGTVTIPAGQEKGVVIDNGTVNLVLSKAQVAYGYSTTAITMQGWGSVVFKDESGNVLQTWNSSQSPYSISSSANTWTPDSSTGTGNFWDAARWSQGLPSAGDYVIFNDTVGDSEMTLNLSSDFNLGYVLVTGTKLTISEATGTATLSVDTFRNTAIAAIATLKCAPTTVVPEGNLRLLNGLGINCEVDSSLAGNMKYYYDDTLPAMYFGDIWKGTVVFAGYVAANLDLSYWANDDSVVRLNGVSGYLKPNKAFPYTVELIDNGETAALNWSNGSSEAQSTFNILTGTGTFQTTAGGGNNEKALIKDVSGFTGSFNLAAKNVAIADAMPDDATGNNGRLYVEKEVEISSGKTWAANGGLYLGADADLTVSGAFATGSAINTYGAGAVLTIEDGGSVKVNGAISGDNAPTLNFNAGTYQITRSLTETKTVNFCAVAGKYTTLDANGNTFTLGANFFSGSGDVYLKTSASGGAFVIQGIPASYTGTIYVDNSIGLTIRGDISQMGGKLNISDITLSRDSANIGKIDVCSGATLQVVLTDDEAMEGLTVTGVTLNGGTIEFVDQRGTVVGSSTDSLVYVKPEGYTVPGPEPTAIWYGDFSSSALTQFAGYTIDDWNETHGENMSSVTIDRNNQGLLVDFASAKGYFTVLVKYTNLVASTSSKRVLFATTANSSKSYDRCGIRLLTDSKVQGLWNVATDSNSDADYGSASTGTVPSAGTLAFVYDKGTSGVSAYVAGVDESLPSTALWTHASLKAGDAHGFAVGGMCRDAAVSGVEAAKGMTISGLAIFDRVLTASELKYFSWPEDEEDPEVPEITYAVTPAPGAVAAGTKMTVTCSDPDATIWYKNLTDADYTEYTEPVELTTGINYLYVKVNDGEATLYTYIVSAPEPAYDGPAPVAVWVAGEFGDDRSAHGGLEFALNGNTTNALGQIVIGSDTTLGATVAVPEAAHQKMTMLVKYSIPSGGAPVANSVPASIFSSYDLGARAAQAASSALDGYWYNGSSVQAGTYAFSTPAQTVPQDGYILISTWATNANPNDHGTAVYSGETLSTLSGGEKTGLRFTGADRYIASVGVGGPTVAGAKPWAGMVVKSVALFDEWVTPSDLASYSFPAQGAVQPVDSDRYAIDPVVSWVNDFKTTTKGDYTLSVSGTTAAKDDTFGGTLTIGDAAAVIDTTSAEAITVLVKYRAAPNIHSAPVVTFGGQAAVTFDSGICTDTSVDRQLAAYYSFIYNNARQRAINAVDGNPTLSSDGGYVVCARKYNACHAYVGDSLDNMTGGECTTGMQISNSTLKKIGIGGQTELSSNDANMVPFTGFVVEKVVVFNGYYTPDQILYVPNPEDGDTINIAAGATWNFAAGETRTYTNIGSLNEGGTIAVTNAATLAEGVYTLATWTTAQKKSTGYGHVSLSVEGIPDGLSAELVYGAKAIYLRVWNQATQAARGTIKVWPYGDSITEGFNAGGTRANYRVLLAQKLSMLGFNVEMVGCYDKINGADVIDPAGQVVPDAWKWHSAKHGATAGPTTSATGRANLCENVDTLSAQAGNPDVVLLLAGANDIVPATGLSAAQVVSSITNIVAHLASNLPNTKIVIGNQINVESGYNSGNYNHVVSMIPQVNALLKTFVDNLPEELVGRVFLADLNSYVKSGEYGILFDHGSDHLHPDWWGHDQMAEGWLSVITNKFTATQVFPSATVPAAPATEELGAAAKDELADYRSGYKLCRTINVANSNAPSVITGDGATENIEKVGYFVEYVRDDNHAHKWVWVDMDAFGTTIGDVGLPTANHQQVVTKLHVKSNHNGIDDVAANDDSVSGFIEFSPYDYNGNVSGVSGAPTGNASCCDWNDTLSTSGSYGCMQVHRVFSPAKSAADGVTRGGQVLFAYNNWQSSSSTAEFGIGNYSSHFYRGANDAQTLDYTYTANAAKMNASAYSVKRIEIWTKGVNDEPEEKTTSTTDFPVPYSWVETYAPGIAGYPDAMYETVAKSPGDNGYTYWESYVLGLDPTNAMSKFVTTIRMEGQKPVVEYSPTNEVLKAVKAIEYILQGKPALTNGWQDVEFDEPGDTNRFFRVKVEW